MNKNGVCRLCLEVILDDNFRRLDDIMWRMLQSIPLTLDASITADPIVCSTCGQNLQMLFEFKMSCLSNNTYVKTYVGSYDTVKLNLEKLVGKKVSSKFEDTGAKNVCRFCLGCFEKNFFVELNNVEQDMFLKDMLDKCLSEIDLNITENPLMCKDCMELLENQFNFMMSCLDNEEKINYFLSAGKRDSLSDILERMKSLESESENVGVKAEFLKIVPDSEEKNLEGIQECVFYVKIDDNIKQGSQEPLPESLIVSNVKDVDKSPSNDEMFKCLLCSFQTKRKNYLKKHSIVHLDPSQVQLHKCDKCEYATKWKSDLKKHYVKHETPSSLSKFKCHICLYQGKNQKSLARHYTTHSKQNSTMQYKCNVTDCIFGTTEKFILKRHYKFKHKKDVEIDILDSKFDVKF